MQVESEVQIAAAAIEAIVDIGATDQLQILRTSIIKLVQLAGYGIIQLFFKTILVIVSQENPQLILFRLHGTIMQDEKYTFQHTTQLYTAYEKFTSALHEQQNNESGDNEVSIEKGFFFDFLSTYYIF